MKTTFTQLKMNTLGVILVLAIVSLQTSAQTKHSVQVSNNVFSPDELSINVGDTVEWKNIQGFHNVNGTKATYPNNPESFGNSTGNGWTYSYVFKTAGKYDYRCDPHVGLGMTGKIEVLQANDDGKYLLTVNFSSMNPHVGQTLYLSVTEKSTGEEIGRLKQTVSTSFSVQVPGLEKDHSYWVRFFSDHNANGKYDAPPVDHAWQLEANNVQADTDLNFVHNTNFTDVAWKNRLVINFSSMNPHVGQTLNLWVREVGTSSEVFSATAIVSATFTMNTYGIENGKSYTVDFYSDHNGNGSYDAPPTDHSWRLQLTNVVGDTALNFVHNTNFTDISGLTGIDEQAYKEIRMYPNPATTQVSVEYDDTWNKPEVSIYNLAGKLQTFQKVNYLNTTEMNVSSLPSGIYVVKLYDRNKQQTIKLVKE